MIEDAKFETVTNLEFEKRERTLSSRNSISEEEEEVFAQNGELISPVESEPPHLILLIITIKEGISSLSRILRIFEVRKFFSFFFYIVWSFGVEENMCRFFFIVCVYLYCGWIYNYQERRVRIQITGLHPPHFVHVSNQELGFQRQAHQ